jgi:hypothetical protein
MPCHARNQPAPLQPDAMFAIPIPNFELGRRVGVTLRYIILVCPANNTREMARGTTHPPPTPFDKLRCTVQFPGKGEGGEGEERDSNVSVAKKGKERKRIVKEEGVYRVGMKQTEASPTAFCWMGEITRGGGGDKSRLVCIHCNPINPA